MIVKDIKGFPRYSVREDGAIITKKTGRVLKPLVMTKGDRGARLYINNTTARITKVHRLVAIAFHNNPLQYPQVNHKDGDKSNNSATNLEWCSNLQNHDHSIRTGLWSPSFKHKEKYPEVHRLRSTGLSQRKIASKTGISKSQVSERLKVGYE